MRVAVIGAGIGGLTAAIGLQRAKADVTVFERAPGPRPSGSGLSLWGNAFAAADAIGLDLRSLGAPQWNLTAGQRRPDGRWLSVIPPSALRELRVIHRTALPGRGVLDPARPGRVQGLGRGWGAGVWGERDRSRTWQGVVIRSGAPATG